MATTEAFPARTTPCHRTEGHAITARVVGARMRSQSMTMAPAGSNGVQNMSKRLGLAVLLLPIMAVASCSSCGTGVGKAKEGTLTGSVFKGPVATADVVAFDGNSGRRGEQIGAGKTADDGTFSISVGSHEGPIVVCATKGTYTEEATGGLVQLGANELCGLVTAHEAGATSNVVITPLTTLHTALTGCFVDAGRDADFAAAEAHSALRLNDFFAAGQTNFDIRGLLPLDPTTAVAPSLTSEAWAGILIAGLSESAKGYAVASGLDPGVRVTAATLTAALSQDIDDGVCVFDGRTATARLVQGDIELNENALRGSPQGLSTSILRFLESDRNLSGISEQSVRDLVQTMQAHRSEIFGGGNGSSDIDGPVVTFTEPAAGSTRGGLVRVTVKATDVSAITEFTFTGPEQATFTAAVFTCTDDTKTDCTLAGEINTSAAPIEAGPTTVSVRAVDASGNPTPATLSFVVNNDIPQITVTSPQAGEPVQNVVEIRATAQDESGVIESLTVEIPGVGLCSDQPESPCRDLEPATDELRVSWDTTTAPEGDFTLIFHARDGAGQPADDPFTVIVDNNDRSTVRGVVDLGSPVIGADVTVVDWSGRIRGAVLGAGVTDEDGFFAINLDDEHHESVLLVVTGGSYTDVSTSLTLQMNAGHELTAGAGNIQPGETRDVNVNPWTTLAATRARHTPEVQEDAFAIGENIRLLSQHLRRPNGIFDASRVRSIDLTAEVTTTASERAVLALSHAGLSRMAAELSIEAGSAPGAITTTELVRLLAKDLEIDPLLDGVGPEGAIIIPLRNVPLTAATTRFDLAAATDRFVTETPFLDGPYPGVTEHRNNSSVNRAQCLSGRIYSDVAEDAREALYPFDQPVVPFDTTAPAIDLRFIGPHSSRVFGDILAGTATIRGDATDEESEVTRFVALLGPEGVPLVDDDADNDDAVLQVSIGTEVQPNGADAVEVCPNAAAADLALAGDDLVCVCALAADEQDNVGEALHCFARPAPVIAISLPTQDSIFSSTQAVVIDAAVSSGFDLSDCVATATAAGQATRALPAVINDTTCDINESLSGLGDAVWTITVDVIDVAGRSAQSTRSFRVDASPPTVSITAPTIGSSQTSFSFNVFGEVASTGDLASVTVRLNNNAITEQVLTPGATATTWGTTITDPCTPACAAVSNYEISVFATDISGNRSATATRTVVVDTRAPTLAFAPGQNEIVNYDATQPVERVGAFTCPANGPCIDRRTLRIGANAERIVASDVFANSAPSSRPVVRWQNLLESTTDVPVLRYTVSDTSPVSVFFSFDTVCSATPQRRARLDAPGAYSVALLASNFEGGLIGLSVENGTGNLCVSVVAVDAAGNRSSVINKNLRWRTLAPPLPVTMNPTSLNVSTLTYPDGIVDVGTFAGDRLDNLERGVGASYAVVHGYLTNPWPFEVRASVGVGNNQEIRFEVDARKREVWNTEPVTKITSNAIDKTMRNPCNAQRFVSISPNEAPAPEWDDYVSLCSAATGQKIKVNSYESVPGFSTMVRGASEGTAATRPTTLADQTETFLLETRLISPTPNYYRIDGGTGEPVSAALTDATGTVSVSPGETIAFIFKSRNSGAANVLIYDTDQGSILSTDASTLFLDSALRTLNPSLPALTMTNTIFLKSGGTLGRTPSVIAWGRNLSGNNDSTDRGCDAGECGLGLSYTEVDRIRIETVSSATAVTVSTATSQSKVDWSGLGGPTVLPSVLRSLEAP
jgi:hypothetical protein